MHVLAQVLLLATEEGLEEPNPILPEINEIVWGTIAFFALFILLKKFALPTIQASLKDRTDKIRSDLEAAEAQKTEASQVLGEYQRQLSEARNDAGRIIEEARKAADELRKQLMAQAEQEAVELRGRAQADIDATVAQAKADLQRQVAEFAIVLAEKVVEKNLDHETQQQLIERYIAEVGGMSGARGIPEGTGSRT